MAVQFINELYSQKNAYNKSGNRGNYVLEYNHHMMQIKYTRIIRRGEGYQIKNFISLILAIDYIEQNLRVKTTVADTAAAAYISPSHLQSMFYRAFRISVGDYIIKRKLCRAADDLINSSASITEIAYDCGYQNAESFSRAFKKQFLHAPSVYRKEYSFTQLYPPLTITEGSNTMEKRYDLSEIMDCVQKAKGTYSMNIDIDYFDNINKTYSHNAGDMVIAETSARIGRSIAEGMKYYRIGGDQFVVLTGSDDLSAAETIAKKMLSYSETPIEFEGRTIKFTVSMGIIKIPADTMDAEQVMRDSNEAMMRAKSEGRNCYKII